MRTAFRLLFSLILLFGAYHSACAVETQPKLAILSESAFGQAGDLLSVELSQQTNVVLLERSAIDRILKEQKLALSGISVKESIKVGQLLGADGLLTLNTIRTGTNTYLVATLIAVKQGVILDAMESPWPMKDESQWAKLVRAHFQPFLPKLDVLAKDSLPISVLNLRSAASSPESKQLEHELTELLLNRLTHEKELFILERRKLDKLTMEKEFAKTGDSPFWNGSYLLEGIVDKNGFSKETATISARMVPPGGGAPVEIEISGKRNQPEELIEQLARRILASLKKQSSAPEWKPAAEALQYYEEARWALKWKLNQEAQAAAESAWALGKRDMDCALVRIKAYLTEVAPTPQFEHGSIDSAIELTTLEDVKNWIKPIALVWDRIGESSKRIRYVAIINPPNAEQLDKAIHAINLYRDFSQTLPLEEPKMDSDWYRLGVSVLTGASQVLQHFYLVSKSQKGVEDKLAELRHLSREVSDYILKSPSVHDFYWVGTRIANHDKLGRLSDSEENIFRCNLLWGSYWQERPEDSIALYRGLMTSEVFCYIHDRLWFRELENPVLPTWHPEDLERARLLWSQFKQELNGSTNLFLRLEGKSLQLAQAANQKEMESSFNGLISLLFDNREAIVTDNVELLYLEWRLGDLVSHADSDASSPAKDKLQRQIYQEYGPRLRTMDQEYWRKMDERKRQEANQALFEKQKELLRGNSYDFSAFAHAFSFYDYSPVQAAELESLCTSYKPNLMAQASQLTGVQKSKLQGGISHVESIERSLARILRPPPQNTEAQANRSKNTNVIVVHPTVLKAPELSAQVLLVDSFWRIPEKLLPGGTASNIKIYSHHVREDKLLLDLRYDETSHSHSPISDRAAIAIWSPKNRIWQMIPYPPDDDPYARPTGFLGGEQALHVELFKSAVYLSAAGSVMRYDLESKRWEKVNLPESKLCQLFAIGGHLYAANDESIFEILDRKQGTRMLASTRRRPAVTALDSLDSLGYPNSQLLFPGPGQTVRTFIGNKLYTWNGKDWDESMNLALTRRPEAFENGTLLRCRSAKGEAQVWFLAHAGTKASLYWEEHVFDPFSGSYPTGTFFSKPATNEAKPLWQTTSPLQTAKAPGIATLTNLHFFHEDCIITNTAGEWSAAEKNGHHAFLICMESGTQKPVFVPLEFDLQHGPVPSASLGSQRGGWGLGPVWLEHVADHLAIGYAGMPGLWAIPDIQLEAAICRERKLMVEQEDQEVAKTERMRKELLVDYDLNHDGILDPVEKESAVEDIRWLQLNWHLIDTDRNGLLDPEDDLTIFDANQNGQAESSELLAMDKIQTLVAAELIRRWDQDRDGALSEQELRIIIVEEHHRHATSRAYFDLMNWSRFDSNQDRKLDQKELERLLISLYTRSIANSQPRAPGLMSEPLFNWTDSATMERYKRMVESAWRQQRRRTEQSNPGAKSQFPIRNTIPFEARLR